MLKFLLKLCVKINECMTILMKPFHSQVISKASNDFNILLQNNIKRATCVKHK